MLMPLFNYIAQATGTPWVSRSIQGTLAALGLALAGAIGAALFKRERTGEPSVVDLSLLGLGMWSMASAISGARMQGKLRAHCPPPLRPPACGACCWQRRACGSR